MSTEFWKYQGTGNDFVVINNMTAKLEHSPALAQKLCDRHFGIGSDGLIIIEESEEADFKMIFYNPDGSQSFCGNGSRCAVRFAFEEGIIKKNATTFLSTDGSHGAEIVNGSIDLQMKSPTFMPLSYEEKELPITHSVFINTGSPHLILFIDNKLPLTDMDVKHHGARIRYQDEFYKEGVNVNFVSSIAPDKISIRTYERGVENETLSCGTGVTASAIAWHSLSQNPITGSHHIEVFAVGGKLDVKFDFGNAGYTNTRLCGPAENIFKGIIHF